MRAATDMADDDNRTSGIVGNNVDCREAEDALKRCLGTVNVADVIERELVWGSDDAEIGEERTAAGPQPPFERTLHAYDFEKFTFGTCVAAGGASKNG